MKRSAVLIAVLIALRIPYVYVSVHRPGYNWTWGGEATSIAHAIYQGQGFASPYFAVTGPTAQQPPIFPYMMGKLAQLLGGMEPAERAVLALNLIFSAAAGLVLIAIGKRWNLGLLPGWLWALLPLLGWTESAYVWSTALYTLSLTALIALILRLPRNLWLAGLFAGTTL